jgi:uncharacterized protein with NRDE domain
LAQHPDFALVCVHNRDEDLARPTAPPAPDAEVIAGRDVRTGGTWMGFNRRTGSLVAVTNHRLQWPGYGSAEEAHATSRGVLVNELLGLSAEETRSLLQSREKVTWRGDFAGFNLFHANIFEPGVPALFVSNRPHGYFKWQPEPEAAALSYAQPPVCRARAASLGPGTYCVSNGEFQDPAWPKVRFLCERVAALVREAPSSEAARRKGEQWDEEGAAEALASRLAEALLHREPFPAESLPDLSRLSENAAEERALQRVFIAHERGKPVPPLTDTGTRAQTIVVASRRAVYYWYRSTDTFPDLPPFTKFVVPLPPPGAQTRAWYLSCLDGPWRTRIYVALAALVALIALAAAAAASVFVSV